ncbi:tripartite tricarboxylate transporter substrate binding protein [Xylophilus sp. GOD-11R]|uniref:Bug family tripartite tricarboxylate transporter substrate binding protein n=1 Tax=Xylophilus sp. GOD-11R TaxID=3089814 RepID=UPI00298D5072|nr:tripartite tricarboxylate transporter substrate binding protein [Xylophilus sp. GOD-11R]WPB55911.1 tripartite tricarboxylate transporter substrate binding protein [Xylophilus sp. GOD-11R]
MNLIDRRRVLRLATVPAMAAVVPAHVALAAGYPERPIRLYVASVAGGLVDIASREFAERMGTYLGQPMVVENVPGASTIVAARKVAALPPDGYALMSFADTFLTAPLLNKSAGYDAARDFAGIGELARSPLLLVVPAASPIRSLADLVESARRSPGRLSYGSTGVGGTSHLPVVQLARQARIEVIHVPFKGVTAIIPDLLAGRIDFTMGTATSFHELLKAGKMRAIAVSSESRVQAFPDVPTFRELGYPGASSELFIGLVAPAGTPMAVRIRLVDAMRTAKIDPKLAAKFESLGQSLAPDATPAQFDQFYRAKEEGYRKLVSEAGITAD